MISNDESKTEIQNITIKKNIIFLFSGQSRISPFSHNIQIRSNDILNSYDELIFTNEFKELYDYKI